MAHDHSNAALTAHMKNSSNSAKDNTKDDAKSKNSDADK